MCGIVGVLRARPGTADDLLGEVGRMSEILRHRGPDDAGDWVDPTGRAAMAFRRLAIIDLSPMGHQPMRSPSGRFVMVFNGEVYNHRDLRGVLQREGVTFRGGSDTEVILAAFERWGVSATLPKLNGMFGIALWDHEREELTLVRDRLGIKPLYVARTSEGVAFASELGALTGAVGLDRTLDVGATLAYLGYLFVPAPGTPLKSVRKLAPGHVMRIRDFGPGDEVPQSEPFWTLAEARSRGRARRTTPPMSTDGGEEVEELSEILTDSVRLRMVADVPVGAFLSGGIDSSLVVALMQTLGSEPARTFTIGFDQPEHDESVYARAIAEYLGTAHTELHVTDHDALAVVPDMPDYFDEPLADPSQIPTFLVSRLAREHVTVALSGDGGDELFAGYTRYSVAQGMLARFIGAPVVGRRLLGSFLRAVPAGAWHGLQGLRGNGKTRLLAQKARKFGRILRADSPGEMYRCLLSPGEDPERFLSPPGSGWDPIRDGLPPATDGMALEDMQFLDQRYYLPDDLLQKVDRASMAVSLEARVPILDHRVVEFSWGLRDDLKIRGGESKWLLRQLLYRHVPRELLDRPKTGFSVPVEAWMRGALRELAEEHLLGRSGVRDGLFDPAAIRRSWSRFLSGHNEDALALWAIVMFEAWRDRWKIDDVRPELQRTI